MSTGNWENTGLSSSMAVVPMSRRTSNQVFPVLNTDRREMERESKRKKVLL